MSSQEVAMSTASLEIDALYAQLSPRLERTVRAAARGVPPALVEDACQVAWQRLIRHRHRVRPETVLGWLSRTAQREAVRLAALESRCSSWEQELELRGEPAGAAGTAPAEALDRAELLAEVRALPHRQQRLLWLFAMGLSYAEMADHEGCTRRTVERQLLRARRAARHLAAA